MKAHRSLLASTQSGYFRVHSTAKVSRSTARSTESEGEPAAKQGLAYRTHSEFLKAYSERRLMSLETKAKKDQEKRNLEGALTVASWKDSFLKDLKRSKSHKSLDRTARVSMDRGLASITKQAAISAFYVGKPISKDNHSSVSSKKPATSNSINLIPEKIVTKNEIEIAINKLDFHLNHSLMKSGNPNVTLWRKRYIGKPPQVEKEVEEYLIGESLETNGVKPKAARQDDLSIMHRLSKPRKTQFGHRRAMMEIDREETNVLLNPYFRKKMDKVVSNLLTTLEHVLKAEFGASESFAVLVNNNTRERSQLRYLLLDFKRKVVNPNLDREFVENVVRHNTIPSLIFYSTPEPPKLNFVSLSNLLKSPSIKKGQQFADGDVIVTDYKTYSQANCIVQRVESFIMELEDFYQKLRDFCFKLKLRNTRLLRQDLVDRRDKLEHLSRNIIDDTDYLPNERNAEKDIRQHERLSHFSSDRRQIVAMMPHLYPQPNLEGVNDYLNMHIAVNNATRALANDVVASLDQLNLNLSKPKRRNLNR